MKHLLYSNQYGDTISYYCCRIKNAVMVTMRISLPWKHLCRCDTGVTKRVIRQLTTDNCQPTSPRPDTDASPKGHVTLGWHKPDQGTACRQMQTGIHGDTCQITGGPITKDITGFTISYHTSWVPN